MRSRGSARGSVRRHQWSSHGEGNVAAGAAIGTAAGVGVGVDAATLMNAKPAHKMICAQNASTRFQDRSYTTHLEGRASASGGDRRNCQCWPAEAGPADRSAGRCPGTNAAKAALPNQYVCRTPEGDYKSYGIPMVGNANGKRRLEAAGPGSRFWPLFPDPALSGVAERP